MVCLDARQAQRARSTCGPTRPDANDADGLAHLVRAGWYKEVRVKSRDAMLSKAVSAARKQLLEISTNLSNQICGLMKSFGLGVPKGKGRIFEANVRRLLDEEHALAAVVLPLLEAWCAIRNRAAELDGSCSVRCPTTRIDDGS
jgi:transposase